jgi:rod shape-determining protein MreC
LKETNRQLAEENARLRNMLASDFIKRRKFLKKNSSTSLVKDTLGRVRKFTWLPAKVVGNSYTLQSNYIQVERGTDQGVKRHGRYRPFGRKRCGRGYGNGPNYSAS